ncbi:MAG: DNA mismatch repair protein MutS [Verrucomicrobia bacterium]|nr:DNA mismatch repair protein MutS [Verrucomicrobiota bacterium]
MQRQYREFREKLPGGTLLLFRLGDFYEVFGEDAEIASRTLGLTLTKRHQTPMAGLPYHAASAYVNRLLAAGWKVAICDQLEAPVAGKLVRRGLTRILTPGTALEDSQLDSRKGNFLAALAWDRSGWHAAWLDVSTADFRLATDADPSRLLPLLHSVAPREVLLPEGLETTPVHRSTLEAFLQGRPVTRLPGWNFDVEAGARLTTQTLSVHGLGGFGLTDSHPALGCAGAVLGYVTDSLCDRPKNLRRVVESRLGGSVLLDAASARNLELFNATGGGREGSLLDAIDRTCTPAGARLLASWLVEPSTDMTTVRQRQEAVGEFVRHPGAASRVAESLRGVRDVPRILARLQNRFRNPRELGGIRDTLTTLPALKDELSAMPGGSLADLAARLSPEEPLLAVLRAALSDELPADLTDGGVMRAGFDQELDRLRSLASDSKSWIADFERREQERTGIKSLKVRYNGAFGYAIEVTKANLGSVPADYLRKQTMVNAERFTTEELRVKEKEALRADEQALAREGELFQTLIAEVLARSESLLASASVLAEADVLRGWADLSRECKWCQPTVDDSDALEIVQGRHPVVEKMLLARPGAGSFVPNDTRLAGSACQIALITGPNMAGKSTYIRQVALIALLAHLGCWVPAQSARIGLVDRVFCRVGASDELARGNSTFMVEMNETSNILNNATQRSLVVLDEIGRGTSTYDGISIAWAVAEHLHGAGPSGPRTLFATHYHELTRLADSLPRLKNYSVAVKEWKDEIVFVRRVVEGAADRSYGIQVARLAGMPPTVVERARTILGGLESGEGLPRTAQMPEGVKQAPVNETRTAKPRARSDRESGGQMDLFS